MIVFKDHHVYRYRSVSMPMTFLQQNNFLNAVEYIKLQDTEGLEWLVRCIKETDKVRFLSKGWSTFVRDNNLIVRDVCIFELIHTDDPTLKVSIFHANDDA